MDKFERALQQALSDVQSPVSALGLEANMDCVKVLMEKAKEAIKHKKYNKARRIILNMTVTFLDVFDRLTEMADQRGDFDRPNGKVRKMGK
jgi:hypothetical protein